MTTPAGKKSTASEEIAFKQPICRSAPWKAGNWDGTMSSTGFGKFTFINRVEGEPLDIVSAQKYVNWTPIDMIDLCKICDEGPLSSAYEVILEWGDTDKYEWIKEICSRCFNILNKTIVRNPTKKSSRLSH